MIHELREYRFSRTNWYEYLALFRQVGMPIREHNHGRLLGAWSSDLPGGAVLFAHLWAYESLEARAELRAKLSEKAAWRNDFLPRAAALVHSQTLSILHPKTKEGHQLPSGSRAWLHRYQTPAGLCNRLADSLASSGLACWTTEFPDPNELAVLGIDPNPLLPYSKQIPILGCRILQLEPVSHLYTLPNTLESTT